ncbi:MAG: hypothetical protein PHR35_05350, partial [Kiritimatiellae bacterium]|nr:hypothetical protein [Kiritimatiellia bacterium]
MRKQNQKTIIGIWAGGLSLWLAVAAAAAPAPLLQLDFEQGLMPEPGPRKEGAWGGKTQPQYDEHGLAGKALLVTGAEDVRVSFDAPAGTRDKGTLLFWSRGLENWDLWGRGNNRHLWWTSHFFQSGGDAGGVWFYKWGWYDTLTYLFLPREGGGNQAVGTWPPFDQYQWTQLGLSWQTQTGGLQRLRFFLNGEQVTETSGPFPFGTFSLFGNVPQGGRRSFDNLKVWDRSLPPSEVKRLFRQDAQIANQPVVSVPRLAAPPVIDGTLTVAEWAGAARVTGLLEARGGEVG